MAEVPWESRTYTLNHYTPDEIAQAWFDICISGARARHATKTFCEEHVESENQRKP